MKKRAIDQIVEEIDTILDSLKQESKTETLAYQRGYLTGWLARLATSDSLIRQEIKHRARTLDK